MTMVSSATGFRTIGDVMGHLPELPLSRIRLHPPPGTATEEDVLSAHKHSGTLCELVDGVLLEKTVGFHESVIAGLILSAINFYLKQNKLGLAGGADGMLRLFAGQVRIPDVSFVAYRQFPSGKLPTDAILPAYPNLAVEVLSDSNSEAEMLRKLDDYFAAGSELVWIVDPRRQVVMVYTSPRDCRSLSLSDHLDGGTVLPGFVLPISDIFPPAD